MKQPKLLYLVLVLLLCTAAGCGQRKHNREKRTIERERAQDRSETADLSEAVKATDEAAWDSVAAFRQFYNHANSELAAVRYKVAAFKGQVSKEHKSVPLLYRARIQRLEKRTLELEQRLAGYSHTDKASWDDFTRLYSYDLEQLGKDIDKLAKNKK